jgi:hypothetical protein
MTGGFFRQFYVFTLRCKPNWLDSTIIGRANSAVGANYF